MAPHEELSKVGEKRVAQSLLLEPDEGISMRFSAFRPRAYRTTALLSTRSDSLKRKTGPRPPQAGQTLAIAPT